MKIHTNTETVSAVRKALQLANLAGQVAPNVYLDRCVPAGSRTRAHAAEIHLAATDRSYGHRYANTGMVGADSGTFAATYDEWGYMLAHLFAADPDAVAGQYKSAESFHALTKGAYVLTVPAKAAN